MSIDSSIGTLPGGWRLKNLGDIAQVIDPHPSHRAPAKVENGIPFVGIGDVSTDGSVDFSKARLVSHKILDEHKERYSLDDVLIGLGRVASVGKVVRLPSSKHQYVVSPTLAVIRPVEVNYQYLLLALQSPHFQSQLNLNKQGSGRESVGIMRLRVLGVPMPPPPEQIKIVEILEEQLSRLDAALASVCAVREKAARFRRSLLHAAFTGALTGHDISKGTIPVGWNLRRIDEIAKVKGGKRLPKGTKWSETPTRHPYIRATDIKNFRISEENLVYVPEKIWPSISRYVVEANDVIITIAGTIGSLSVVPESLNHANLTENAAKISEMKGVYPKFLLYFLSSPTGSARISELSTSTTQAKLALFRIASIQVPLPEVKTQEKIVEILEEQFSRLDASLAVVDEIESRAAALRRSLLHAAFTGNLTKEWRENSHV